MARTHRYEPIVRWTGDRGSGTSGYRAYARDHEVLGALAIRLATDRARPAVTG